MSCIQEQRTEGVRPNAREKSPDQTLDQAFGLPEVLVAVSTSRLSCKRAGKTRTLMPVWDSSGESRLNGRTPMDFASFAHHPPKFHHWDGQWTEGAFSTYHLQAIYDFCRTRGPEAPVILETGAGNSTVCFLHLNPARMISIAPEQPLFDRIIDYCTDNAINTRPLESYVEGSEWALPRLAS